MLKVRTALAGLVAGAAIVSAAPVVQAAPPSPVTVSFENGVLSVGTQLPGQPLVGASVNTRTGRVCAGFSYQVPVCTIAILDLISVEDPGVVTVDADASDGRVGVSTQVPGQPLLSVGYYTADAKVCVGFSYQIPACVKLGPIN
jgi:hypothetical protein